MGMVWDSPNVDPSFPQPWLYLYIGRNCFCVFVKQHPQHQFCLWRNVGSGRPGGCFARINRKFSLAAARDIDYSFVTLALVGLAAVFYFPLRNRPPEAIFLSSIGIGMVIQNLLVTGLGAAPRRLYIDSFVQSWSMGGFILPLHFIMLFLTTFLIIGALYYFLSYSRLGLGVQAVTQNPDLAMIFGIRPLHTAIASFIIAGLLTAIAAIFLSQNSFLAPEQGNDLLLKAICDWSSAVGAVYTDYGWVLFY